MFEKNQCYPPV